MSVGRTYVREANLHLEEMFKKMITLENEMRAQLEAKDREIVALQQAAAEHAQTKEKLAKAEELIDWLNASLHQKTSCIEMFTAALSSIGHTVRACGLDPAAATSATPTPESSAALDSALGTVMSTATGARSAAGSPESRSPGSGSGSLRGLADQVAAPHFSIADDTDEDY
eukprot:m.234497 g.234497  ORF g.234497 m.234497 type:complete len:171 (-) comp19630_c0_seq1:61-573(-)